MPADSAWLALERANNPMTITVLMRVEGLTAERLLAFLDTYWLAWERFRCMPEQRPTGWWWQADPTFALSHHVQVSTEALDETGLQNWVSARLNQPLPDYRPRWKFWLLPNASGGAALVLRLHHCYADGLSLMGVFDRICTPSPRQAPVLYGGRERTDLARWREAAQSWLAALQAAAGPVTGRIERPPPATPRARLEKTAFNGLRLVNEVSQFLVEPEDTPSPLKRSLLGRRVCRWSAPVALADFRKVARSTGCTINDVLLACVTGAVRRLLADSEVTLGDALVHAAVPVDIRSRLPDGIRPDPGVLGNYFGTVFVPLPVDGDSPLERLYRVKHETRKLKKSWQPGIAWGLTGSAAFLPTGWRQPLADMFCRKASAVVSNVPGTTEPRYLAGCRIREQMFWVPQAGDIGLGISIVSYAGQVQFGVVADEAILPEPAAFLGHCQAALAEFQA
ncbi:MAG: WS/DGAT domain-containing protein [Marinobacter sp.]|uniref:WS/DGAT domain-containing protein n=1 Tax=Marinobacter sp. TaxID=50741 RepID=UPI00299F42A7|nr:WS/DGAT domain-containing protein [Marinobacter sp.]MDX1633307.1 WS/DGAT domain-containing protein [Marinobacter sp.]